jgi:hypothetical protein
MTGTHLARIHRSTVMVLPFVADRGALARTMVARRGSGAEISQMGPLEAIIAWRLMRTRAG